MGMFKGPRSWTDPLAWFFFVQPQFLAEITMMQDHIDLHYIDTDYYNWRDVPAVVPAL